MTKYSPKTLEMVAWRAYAAFHGIGVKAASHEMKGIYAGTRIAWEAVARWHLDEIGGVLVNETARQEHSYRKAISRVIGSKPCPHCK